MIRRTGSSLIGALVVLIGAAPLSAQDATRDSINPASLVARRQTLVARAAELERSAQTLPEEDRADTLRKVAAIRSRLTDGDFHVGDRILLTVDGEKELSDTFTVTAGRILTLPAIGDVPLQGVLRSELEPYLTRRLSESLRDPLVRARPFVRLSVQGAVAKPGYYSVPAEALLSDPLMIAGGTQQDAKVKKLRIEREGKPILQGQALQDAIAAGRTIDDVGLLAGDQYVLPGHGHGMAETLSFAGLLLGLPITIYELTRIF